jgi:hypothetical protein
MDVIYTRQQEVNIGKRNINCLSCSNEPVNTDIIGKHGKVYVGTHTNNIPVEVMSPNKRPMSASTHRFAHGKATQKNTN